MKKLLFTLWAVIMGLSAHAAELMAPPYQFIANKGQWPTQVRFAADVPGGRLFLEPTGFSYNLQAQDAGHHADDPNTPQLIRGHSFRTRLLGAQSVSPAVGELLLPTYHNYFIGNQPSEWATQVPLFEAVRYRQLYPGVDMVWHTAARQLKYDYELTPGTDPSLIRLQYEGLDGLEVVNGALQLHTSLGVITEQAPVAWQTDASGRRHPVECHYVLTGQEVRFAVRQRNPRWALTIDPALIFSTYSSASGGLSANVAAADAQGQVYTAGYTITPPFPVTVGAYQTQDQGADIGLMKLNPTGTALLFATYLGGSGQEYPLDMAFGSNQEPILLNISSALNYPLLPSGGYDRTKGGNQDYVITRLNTTGTQLRGSTYLGGAGTEGGSLSSNASSITVAPNGDVLVGGITGSSDFPTRNGVQNTRPSSTSIEGVVARLDGGLNTLIWSTYLGGSGEDQINDIVLAANGSLYVCGSTNSPNFPLGAAGLNRVTFGNTDGFVLNLSGTGNSIVSGTYLGTTQADIARFVDIDASGRILVAGATLGGYPTTAGVFQSLTATGRVFIHCLNPALTQTAFATQIGLNNATTFLDSNYITGFGIDACGRLLFSAYTTLQQAPLSTDALQRNPRSLYLCALSGDARTLVYGSYFGGPQGGGSNFSQTHLHFAASNQITRTGDLYHVECTTSNQFPTTPGVYAPARIGTSNNAGGIFKFSFSGGLAPLRASIAPVLPGCAPHLIQFTNTSMGGSHYRWNFGDGSPIDTSFSPLHSFATAGRYRVRLEVRPPAQCSNNSDTTSVLVVATTALPPVVHIDSVKCGQPLELDARGTGTYLWNTGQTTRTITVSEPGSYSVATATPGQCIAEQRFEIKPLTFRRPPNIITPNHDDKNDYFKLLGPLQGAELRVFNRWGKEVFHSRQYDNTWQADSQPAGIYYYLATRPECGITYKGWLEITR
ncbi:gliding motility-associated C-terminal domain-containing protein [Hymenobacter sp. BT186]|uniref:Gliding motility-associated C-terminal domain-containing protein n=1 Tax=Hymenobacter telluris TaxID=2816474 RepID=A0A939EVM5_9BACT|nr:gliding motility-associated C-terminal domain-containing protein [Hymenobacter telluris]MBO0357470.1 gliding motility-associated C-terminal domain-containing protein [Hymenobacter telluris]MBW3373496.1 gliding motility-associated C-terminal domain-containing protein [Hymenobacter norwichensis]